MKRHPLICVDFTLLDRHEKSSALLPLDLDRRCAGWCAARLLRLLPCSRSPTTVRQADQGDHRGGRIEADLPDLHAAGVAPRSTACGGDARLGSKQCADAKSDGVWVRAPCG